MSNELDGATAAPDAMAMIMTPGEFAARWNTMTEADRVEWVTRIRTASDQAFECFLQMHAEQLEAAQQRIETLEAKLPKCDGGCNYNDGPDEMCSLHGRRVAEVWEALEQRSKDLDDALAEKAELQAQYAAHRDVLIERRDEWMHKAAAAEAERDALAAALAAIRKLRAKWADDLKTYPVETDVRAWFAATAVEMCDRELAAILDSAPADHLNTVKAEAIEAVRNALIESAPPLNSELRYDGSEDKYMAAYVAGWRDAVQAVDAYRTEQGEQA